MPRNCSQRPLDLLGGPVESAAQKQLVFVTAFCCERLLFRETVFLRGFERDCLARGCVAIDCAVRAEKLILRGVEERPIKKARLVPGSLKLLTLLLLDLRSALSDLVARIAFANHVNSTTTLYDLAVRVSELKSSNG